MTELDHMLNVIGVPLGVDFPQAVVSGLLAEYQDQPPDALARVHLIVNTRRMARRMRAIFDAGPPCLLPKIGLVTDFAETRDASDIPPAVSPLKRRLELVQLVGKLLEAQPDLAPRANLFDLADSLASLMDEMQAEGVGPDDIARLDVSDQSGHWSRILAFLGIIRPYFHENQTEPDREARQRMVIEHLVKKWTHAPPEHPVIVAGSTGSRGPTQLLMRAVAQLPNGRVVLPGFDFSQSDDVWDQLTDHGLGEDHPQFRFADLMSKLGSHPRHIKAFSDTAPANTDRNRLISLAMRPAPVTDQWLRDGPDLEDTLPAATENISLVEAPTPRSEALTIAMRLRQAVEDGETAALIATDRTLTRQVTAALDRWNILPDDSAGIPLHQSAPGRFMRHVAELFRGPITTEQLFTLLKHPLTHSGADRGPHLLHTRELELFLRKKGCPAPTEGILQDWLVENKTTGASEWGAWISACLLGHEAAGSTPISDHIKRHIGLAEAISNGSIPDQPGKLWGGDAGAELQKTVSDIAENAQFGGVLTATDYGHLFHSVLSQGSVRNADEPHPQVLIWGTLEARVQGADLVILAGLNESSWPEAPPQDPWFNRVMRKQVGLTLPDRRIGLSAHDFQQAICAKTVWLTRSVRSDDAQTVPSRWLNRIQNLMCGLPQGLGNQAFEDMRQRGQIWLECAEELEKPDQVPAEDRPAPCPPTQARPKQLSVTAIKRLIRDPYAIYAQYVLRLKPLNALMREPDALLRGTVLHDVLETFVRDAMQDSQRLDPQHLQSVAKTVLEDAVHWPEARLLWQARIERVSDWFVAAEKTRRETSRPVALEVKGAAEIASLDFTLTAKADRIDLNADGGLHIIDYKTGTAPSKKEQLHFDKQLLLEAAIAERSGFKGIDPAQVAAATFISLGTKPSESPAPLDKEPPSDTWAKLIELISEYLQDDRGYVSRRAVQKSDEHGDYDHLARFGEWDQVASPKPEKVGQ